MSHPSWNTCDLYDRFESRARVPELALVDYGGAKAFAGRIVTVRCFEDNSRIKALSETPGEGRVILVDGGASRRCALIGDMIAGDLAAQGWAGLILNACVRDVAALGELPIGIKALGSTPRKSVRRGEGQVDVALAFGGVDWRPGDVVFADVDGVLALTADDAAGVG